MLRITDWQSISRQARSRKVPIVVMIDQHDCPYCRQAEEDFFNPILTSGELGDKVIVGKVSIDEGETILDEHGNRVSTREFLADYADSFLTPTVLFLDHAKRELVERIVGMLTPDYYGFYLERAMHSAAAKI